MLAIDEREAVALIAGCPRKYPDARANIEAAVEQSCRPGVREAPSDCVRRRRDMLGFEGEPDKGRGPLG